MDIQASFHIPPAIESGLLKGTLVRRGGVIQRVAGSPAGGQIVAWLRENSLKPDALSRAVLGGPGGLPDGVMNALNLAGSAASVLNLGATMAFGVATLSKLSAMDEKLDRISEQLSDLSWQVEFGFHQVLEGLERLHQDARFAEQADLESAAHAMWAAQLAKPETLRWELRVENARHTATVTCKRILKRLAARVPAFMEAHQRCEWVAPPAEFRAILAELRTATSAVALLSGILAEIGDIAPAAGLIERRLPELRRWSDAVAVAWLGRWTFPGHEQVNFGPHELLVTGAFDASSSLSREEVDRWLKHFDPAFDGLDHLLQELRRARWPSGDYHEPRARVRYKVGRAEERIRRGEAPSLHGAYMTGLHLLDRREELRRAPSAPSEEEIALLRSWVSSLEGLHADLDRLDGRVVEYRFVASKKLSLQDYRERLSVDLDADEERPLVFLVDESAL